MFARVPSGVFWEKLMRLRGNFSTIAERSALGFRG